MKVVYALFSDLPIISHKKIIQGKGPFKGPFNRRQKKTDELTRIFFMCDHIMVSYKG